MSAPNPQSQSAPAGIPRPGFPYATAAASLAALFVFAGLALLAYNPQYLQRVLGTPSITEPGSPVDSAARLNEIRAKNQAAIDGKDQLSIDQAIAAVLANAERSRTDAAGKNRGEDGHGHLPFPVPPGAIPTVPMKK